MKKQRLFTTRQWVLMAMLSALAYLIMSLVRIPVVLFLKYEPKDVIITVGGFLMGPLASFLISLVVSLVEMVSVSDTGPIGALMNLLSTCTFACTAAVFYKKKHNLKGAVLGLALGSVTMVGTMLLWNWLVTPWYMGQPREVVESLLIPAFLPFNLLKSGLNTACWLPAYSPKARQKSAATFWAQSCSSPVFCSFWYSGSWHKTLSTNKTRRVQRAGFLI